MEKKLSVIIPCYNAEPYIHELLGVLNAQIRDEVEVIIVDDGSEKPFETQYGWARVIRQKNGGASVARNTGLDNAVGEYIAFIDADDLVNDRYFEILLAKIEAERFDYCYLSWKTLAGGWNCTVKLNSISDKFPKFNLCVWNRVYRRDMIGEVRFNPKKLIAEDAEFIRDVREEGRKKAFISEYMYYYRSQTPNSLTKRFAEGKLDTKRVVYNFAHVTSDMTYLLEEFKETDRDAEVILMTYKNDLPELERYAMVIPPTAMRGTELRGENTSLFSAIKRPKRYQIVIWTNRTFAIGGIETFIYNFCYQLHKYYDILVLYEVIDTTQLSRLVDLVSVRKNRPDRTIFCDFVIVNRITDKVPPNVTYGKKIQMCHTCKIVQDWKIPQDNDLKVIVSEVAAKSFGTQADGAEIIHNLTAPKKVKGALLLVSATRLGTFEKGERRFGAFARKLRAEGIPFLWLVFSEQAPREKVEGLVHMNMTLNVAEYVKRADYLVALSDSESFGYSIVESLELGTPVITTPIDVLSELGFENGVHGYTIPFDVENTPNLREMYEKRPKFKYKNDNASIIAQWRSIFGDMKPTGIHEDDIEVVVMKNYQDVELDRLLTKGSRLKMRYRRAVELENKGLIEIVGD